MAHARRCLYLASSLLLLGCGSDTDKLPPGPSGDAGGGGDVNDDRPEVGPRPFPCPPGELELPAGGCQPAGVPSDGCGQGFAADGDGCAPILPSSACASGTLALPGETSCRPVAPCGTGPWADIPTDSSTQYVDTSFTGASEGTATAPWDTIQAGVDAAAAGAIVAVAPGSYSENVRIEGKAVRLWGKCPDQVELVSPTSTAAVYVRAGGDHSEVRRLAIGDRTGLLVENADDVLVDQLWIHDLTWIGVYVYAPADGATASATVVGTLIEDVVSHGMYNLGSTLDVVDTVVRRVQPTGDEAGRGIAATYADARSMRAALSVTHSIVEDTFTSGIRVSGGDCVIVDTYVHNVDPEVLSGQFGGGLWFRAETDPPEPTNATVRAVVVEDTHSCGLCGFNTNVLIENSTFRDSKSPGQGIGGMGVVVLADGDIDIRPQFEMRATLVEGAEDAGVGAVGSDALFEGVVVRGVVTTTDVVPSLGVGLTIEPQPLTMQPSSGTVRGSLVEQTATFGIMVAGSDAVIEGTIVQDVRPNDLSHQHGRGIGIEVELNTQLRSTATLRNVLVQRTHEMGISVIGSDADAESVTVRDIEPAEVSAGPLGRGFGFGVLVQRAIENDQPASARLSWLHVENTHTAGIAVSAAEVTIANSLVLDTQPLDGDFGDGVLATSIVWELPNGSLRNDEAVVTLQESVIESSARAGLSAFASTLNVGSSWFECNTVSINGEMLESFDFAFTDLGGNQCQCGDESEPCRVLSSNLAPPPLQ